MILYEAETAGDERNKIQAGNQPSIFAVDNMPGVNSTELESEFMQEPTSEQIFDDFKE